MMHYLKTFLFLGSLLGVGFVIWRQLLVPQARAWIDYRLAAVIPIVAIGLCAPSLWIYYGAILAAMLVLPRNRMEAIGLYICLAMMLPMVSYDLKAGSAFLLRLEGNIVASVGLLAAFRFPAPSERSTRSGMITAVVLLFLLIIIIVESRLISTSFTTVLRAATSSCLALGVPYLLISNSAYREVDVRRPLFYLMTTGFILSIVATFEMLRHWPLYQTIDANLGTSTGLSKTLALRGGLLRAPGPFFESTSFGVFLAITTICTSAMRSVFRSPTVHLVALAIGIMGCFATLSRNAWIGLLLGLVVAALYRGRVGKAVVAGGIVLITSIAIIAAAPSSGFAGSLLGKGDNAASSTTTYRKELFVNSIPLIRSSPWVGTSYDRVREYMRPILHSGKLSVDYVNTFLFYLVATGVIGLLVFALFLLTPILALQKIRRRAARYYPYTETCAGLFAAQVALAIMLVGTSLAERLPLLVFILIGMTQLAIENVRRVYREPLAPVQRTTKPEFVIVNPASGLLSDATNGP